MRIAVGLCAGLMLFAAGCTKEAGTGNGGGSAAAQTSAPAAGTFAEQKKVLIGRLRAQLDQLEAQLAELHRRAEEKAPEIRADLDKAGAAIRAKMESLRKELDQAGDKAGQAWEDFKARSEKGLQEIKDRLQNALNN